MPVYPKSNPIWDSALSGLRSTFRQMQEPSDSDVTTARLKGGLGGALEGALDLFAPTSTQVGETLDPSAMMGSPAAIAGSIATKPLGEIASEAYRAVKGIPNLYSRLTNVATKLPDVMPTSQVQAALRGLQAPLEEVNYRKIPELLANKGSKTTRSEVLEHLENNPIELEKHVYTPESDPQPHWEETQTHPHTNYRETVVTLPQERAKVWEDARYKAGQASNDHALAEYEGLSEIDPARVEELKRAADEAHAVLGSMTKPFHGGHWSEFSDVLGWIRSNEKNLPGVGKGRFAETIQSDWHQGGAARGYNEAENLQKYKEGRARIDKLAEEMARENGYPRLGEDYQYHTPEQLDQLNFMEDELKDARKFGAVPEGPFKSSWPGLLMKQELLDIAEQPDLKWFGMLDAPSQTQRWGKSYGPMFNALVSKQRGQMEKLLKPYGVSDFRNIGVGFMERTPGLPLKPASGHAAILPEASKELIRKYGFPVFSALAGLKMATSHGEEQ